MSAYEVNLRDRRQSPKARCRSISISHRASSSKPASSFVLTLIDPPETKSEESSQAWAGEKGHVNKEMLSRFIDDLTLPAIEPLQADAEQKW